jgi:alkanesulfonate monooxygenase SsuD/methylene tetrahydromethanopterin reductase-like flavin-dependent oxidoreductase (luciferase family)
LWLGVFGPRGTRLAGRLGVGLFTLERTNWHHYLEGLEEGGHDAATAKAGGALQAVLSDDPDRDFATLAPRIEHSCNSYRHYHVEGTDGPEPEPVSAAELVRAGSQSRSSGFGILTPAEAAAQVRQLAHGRNVDIVYIQAAVGGVVDETAFRNARLVARELKPLLQSSVNERELTPEIR